MPKIPEYSILSSIISFLHVLLQSDSLTTGRMGKRISSRESILRNEKLSIEADCNCGTSNMLKVLDVLVIIKEVTCNKVLYSVVILLN